MTILDHRLMTHCTGSVSECSTSWQWQFTLQNKAPMYLVDYCIPVSDVASRQHLRYASQHFITVPCFRWSTFGCWAFAVWHLKAWNSLYRTISVIHHSAAVALGIVWKLYFLWDISVLSTVEMLHDIALCKFNVDIYIDMPLYQMLYVASLA